MNSEKKTILMLSIAGSDNTCGAGVQADIKTCQSVNAYCLNCVTAITSQNSKKVYKIVDSSVDLITSQISSILSDYKIDCVKIGLVCSLIQAKTIYKLLKPFKKEIPIVIDPIYKSTTNVIFNNLKTYLLIYKTLSKLNPVFTPNLDEVKKLINISFNKKISIEEILRKFTVDYNSLVVVTNCNEKNITSDDYFVSENGNIGKHTSDLIKSKNTHGTGCTFSTLLAINLARGCSLSESIKLSKKLMIKFILNSPKFNLDYGPLGHLL